MNRQVLVAIVLVLATAAPARADEPRDDLRFGGGVIAPSPALVLADGDVSDVVGVGGGRLAMSGSVERAHTFSPRQWSGWLDGDIFVSFIGGEHARLAAVGTSAIVRYMHWPFLGIGAGVTGGYLIDLTPPAKHNVLQESGFFGLVAVPASLAFDPFDLQVAVPIWFARTNVEGVEAFRPALVGAVFSVTARGALPL